MGMLLILAIQTRMAASTRLKKSCTLYVRRGTAGWGSISGYNIQYIADAAAISQTGAHTETPFCIRQLEQEKIIKDMIG